MLHEGRGYPVRPGLIVIRPPRWAARITAAGDTLRFVSFTWTHDALKALGPLSRGLSTPRTLYGRSSVELAWRAAGELRVRDQYTTYAVQFYTDGVALGLTRGILYEGRGEPALAARARRLLDRNVREMLDLRALANDVGCAPAYLSRLFRQTYGVAPSEYLIRRRVEKARALLAGSKKPIAAIARDLGFHDASHFGRHFRRLAGASPLEFRNRQRDVNSVPTQTLPY